MIFLNLVLFAAPLFVARAPDPRAQVVRVAREGAEKAAFAALEALIRKGEPNVSAWRKQVRVRYGSDGGVELWYEPEQGKK